MDDEIRRKLRPHYLFNELGIIRYMIKKDPDAAYNMVYDFSKYMRGNIASLVDGGLIPWSEELGNIKAMLRLEKYAYGDRLEVEYHVQGDCLVPSRSVTLLVENAIKHGIAGRDEGGTITIRSGKADDGYIIEIQDNGVGFDASGGLENFPGLTYVNESLSQLPGSKLEVESELGRGTVARVYVRG